VDRLLLRRVLCGCVHGRVAWDLVAVCYGALRLAGVSPACWVVAPATLHAALSCAGCLLLTEAVWTDEMG